MANRTYERFEKELKEIRMLNSAQALLHWDMETQMPPRGQEMRANQMGIISGLIHEKSTSSAMGQWLEELSSAPQGLSEEQQTNVRETKRSHDKSKRLSRDLVEELTSTEAKAHHAWVEARKNADFAAFAPWLQKNIDLRKKACLLIGALPATARGEDVYNVALDDYEAGTIVADVRPVFSDLKKHLVQLVARIGKSPRKPKSLKGRYPEARQREFGVKVAEAMGFDFQAGRLDTSVHPFCTSFNPQDVRITTRFQEDLIGSALFGIMHEAGHGLYEQGYDPRHAFTPMADAVSSGIHESQSRLWENIVGRSRPFWNHWYPMLQKTFPEALSGMSVGDFHFSINTVEPSLIRVEADEVTYNLHIMLRFELELGLFDGSIAVSDLPRLWSAKMEEYLGIRPKNDAEGVLQDTHWAMGAFGYFPTYALGNLYAAQFFATAEKDIPGLDGKIAQGQMLELRRWLQEKIHRHGMRYKAPELCYQATGSKLDAQHFTHYLDKKYGELYG